MKVGPAPGFFRDFDLNLGRKSGGLNRKRFYQILTKLTILPLHIGNPDLKKPSKKTQVKPEGRFPSPWGALSI